MSPIALMLCIAMALPLAACAGATTPSAEPVASPPTSASPSPTDNTGAQRTRDAREVLALGESALTPRHSRMTVYSFKPIERREDAPSGSRWYAADIEFCMSPNVKSIVPIEAIREEFGMQTVTGKLQRPDSSHHAATDVYTDPKRTIVANDCVRGPVVFAVAGDDPAAHVGLFIGTGVIRWAVDS
jgi:hypothetical protein